METFSKQIVSNMLNKGIISNECFDDYVYSIQVFIEKAISLAVIFAISILLKCFFEILTFYIVFSVLRKTTGGYHCKGFISCLLLSILASFSGLLTYRLVLIFPAICQGGVILSMIFMFCVAAINHPNINWSQEELVAAKKITRIKIIVFVTMLVFLNFLRIDVKFLFFMSKGIVLCALSMLIELLKQKGGSSYEDREG